ncbi:MAG: hypothetical protein WEB90_04525 [Gemmatimonadota bacterium]
MASTLVLDACSLGAGPTVIVVDPSQTHQTVLSWEATAQLGDSDFPQEQVNSWRDDVIRFAADSVGLNGLRLEVTSGLERSEDRAPGFLADASLRREWRRTWYAPDNDNSDPFDFNESGFHFSWLDHVIEKVVVPMREHLARRGESLFLNLNYVDFDPSAFKQLDDPEEYAELILAVFRHMDSKYGFTPLFIAPSNTSMTGAVAYFDRMLDHPRVLEYLSVLSYHRDLGVSPAALRQIGQRVEQHGVRSGMLEHISSGYEDLHADLEIGRVSMWQ